MSLLKTESTGSLENRGQPFDVEGLGFEKANQLGYR